MTRDTIFIFYFFAMPVPYKTVLTLSSLGKKGKKERNVIRDGRLVFGPA